LSPLEEVLDPLLSYLVHVTVGTAIFVLISSAAVGLHFWMEWLISLEISEFIIDGCRWTKYGVFTADLIAFGVFIVRTTWRLIRRLW